MIKHLRLWDSAPPMHINYHTLYAHDGACEIKLIPIWTGDSPKYTCLNHASNPRASLPKEISLQVSHDCVTTRAVPHIVHFL